MGREARLTSWLALLLIPLLLWPTIDLPLESDEGEYALAAQLWSDGGTPYLDTFLQKPPGILVIYRFMLAFGHSTEVFHLGVVVCYLLAAVLLVLIARRVLGVEHAAVVAVISFALLASSPNFQATAANTEVFMILGVLVSVWCILEAGEGRATKVAAAGLAFGLACLTKQPAVLHAPWLLLLVPTWRGRAVFAGAAALPVAATVLWFAVAGALPQFLDAALLHNLEYVGDSSLEKRYLTAMGWDWPLSRSATLILPLAAVALVLDGRRRSFIVIGGWLLTATLGASLGDVFRGHYAVQLFPPVALAAGAATTRAAWRTWAVLGVMLFVWWVAEGIPFGKTTEQQLIERYSSSYFTAPPIAAEWLRSRATSLYVFGSEATIYFEAGLRPPTRYVIKNPLFGGYPSSRARQEETWRSIGRPSHIVAKHPLSFVPMFPGSDTWLLDRVRALLAADYDTAGVVPIGAREVLPAAASARLGEWYGLVIYERRDSSALR